MTASVSIEPAMVGKTRKSFLHGGRNPSFIPRHRPRSKALKKACVRIIAGAILKKVLRSVASWIITATLLSS